MTLRFSASAFCAAAILSLTLVATPQPALALAPPPADPNGFGCFSLPGFSLPIIGAVNLRTCVPISLANCTATRAAAGICSLWAPDQGTCTDRCNACGNGDVERAKGELCDDGNTFNGDGCDQDCQYEPLYCCLGGVRARLTTAEIGSMPLDAAYNGYDCSLFADGRILTDYTELDQTIQCGCGDGVLDPATEECDLGRSSDGINRNRKEYGCHSCELVCGDIFGEVNTDSYVVDWYNKTDWAYGGPLGIYTEVCDDGNSVNDDDCDNYCQTCGNNQVDAGEKCDLGRSTEGGSLNHDDYGCSDDCTAWTCSNGVVDDAFVVNDAGTDWEYNAEGGIMTEQCDDSNVQEGDGCDRFCQEEFGVCCDVGGYATPSQALTKSDCDNGDGTFNAVNDVNAKPGFENVVTFDLQFGADNSIAERFCAVDAGDKYCCGANAPFAPVKMDPGVGCEDGDATVVKTLGDSMSLAVANKACKPVYCEDTNCSQQPKYMCNVGYGTDWMPPANSEHKAAMQRNSFAFNAEGFCKYWTTPGL